MSSPTVTPHAHPVHLQHHFETSWQQREAAKLGMWIFLATEVLFFGGLFVVYIVLRYLYPGTFLEAHEHLSTVMGGINTLVLITSSLTMALAVRAAQVGNRGHLVVNLWATIGFAFVFLIIKYFEYAHKFHLGLLPGKYYTGEAMTGQPELFFSIYFVMTGLHGVHVVAGIIVIGWILLRSYQRRYSPQYYTPVENVGLYWHLVDLVWIFLFPMLYLVK